MIRTFEADFGEIKITKVRAKAFSQSPTGENEIFITITIWDIEDMINRVYIPSGTVTIRQYELSDLQHEIEAYEYKGVTIKGIASIDGYDMIELRLHYETVEHVNS